VTRAAKPPAPPPEPYAVLGFDPSWGGLGWAVKAPGRPLDFGVIDLSSRTWRWDALAAVLEDHDRQLPPRVRVAIERAPQVYAGRGNQAATAYALGQVSGGILQWATRPGRWAYPWELETKVWRGWWRIGGGGRKWDRAAYKRAAVFYALALLGDRRGELDALAFDPDTGEGPRGDAAEAILITEGADRHALEAPSGPAAWARLTP
jgi:hypothetical protein